MRSTGYSELLCLPIVKAMNRLYLIFFFCVSFLDALSQSNTRLDSYFQEIRKGKSLPFPFSVNAQNAEELISDLVPYLNDSSELVKTRDIFILRDIGINSKQ